MNCKIIPFNKPYMTGNETQYILEAHSNGQLAGNGPFTQRCQTWLQDQVGAKKVLLTHSCTAALEMAALLLHFEAGDEVIMPSYTFVSTANAFVLRGAKPVFVDIREDTLNINEALIEAAISPKTKAIVVVHYAGVACEMDKIMAVAKKHQLYVVEDAAQGVMSYYKGRALGSIAHLATFSFHETKNIISGEGGALLINDTSFSERAEILWEKGTNRSSFFRGEVDKYTWVDVGSSFLPGEIIAAFLWAQLLSSTSITQQRLDIWDNYHQGLLKLEEQACLRRPMIPIECSHNAHMYYILLNSPKDRKALMACLKSCGVMAVFHYVPLHLSPEGKKVCKTNVSLSVTEKQSSCLLRLPLWPGVEIHQSKIIACIFDYFEAKKS